VRGLFDEGGEGGMVAGSGYCCTKVGAKLIDHLADGGTVEGYFEKL